MGRARALGFIALLAAASLPSLTGCQLIADFDRSLIDGGSPEDAGPPIVDATTDTNVPDATLPPTDASRDTGADVAQDATPPNPPDGGGCASPADCPTGRACDTSTGVCTATCSSTQTCNGTCCDDTTKKCATESDTSCGAAGAMCATCAANAAGTACVPGASGGACGCDGPADCPANHACDTSTHACVTACSATQLCNGGCCANGTCSAGTAPGACGATGGACTSCAGDSIGTACIAGATGGTCGCSSGADCSGSSCNTASHACTTACSATQPCGGSCCDGTTCASGAAPNACGAPGGACVDCRASNAGHVCVNSACGCASENDCAVGYACDQSTHQCTTTCSATQPCNGECCSGTTCAPGNTVPACGTAGNMCVSCAGSANGDVCLANKSCGCSTAADCPIGNACDGATHTCTATCSAAQPCNGVCCNGATCNLTEGPTACGVAGMCADCTSPTACPTGVCSCDTTTNACATTQIGAFTAAVTGGASPTLTWTTTDATTCSIDNGVGAVSCNPASPVPVTPNGTTTYTLTATGPGGTTTATATIYCHAATNPARPSNLCATGATQFCEVVVISATSSTQAEDACNTCSGAGLCTQDANDATLGGASGWMSQPASAGVGVYVYGAATSADPDCTPAYTPAAGDTMLPGAPSCPGGRWAP